MQTNLSPGRGTMPGGGLRLPTPPGVVRRFWSRHPFVADMLIASIYLLSMGLSTLRQASAGPALIDVLYGAVVACVTIALVFRRRFPLLLLSLTLIGLVVAFSQYGQAQTISVLFALYAVAVYRTAFAAWVGFIASVLVGVTAAWFSGVVYGSWISVAMQISVMMLAATLIGVNVGNSKRYVAALLELAAQLARDRDQQALLARAAERARIAREMHDVVAHSLSVMVALADGAHAIAPKDPERSREAMLEVGATGRSSMAEMRRLLGVLADDTERATVDRRAASALLAPLAPQPGTDQLVELVESFRSADVPIRLEQNGRGPRNAGVQLTIYRIVQESLTNVLRYSDSPTLVTVRIIATANRVDVVVTDNGLQHAAGPSLGSGRGIIGLQERVALYGGTLNAGPAANRGWRVAGSMTFVSEHSE